MDKSSAVEFLLTTEGAPKFVSGLEETDFWGTRLEPDEGHEYFDRLAEFSDSFGKKSENVYDISDFRDESSENLIDTAERIKGSHEEGLKTSLSERYPSVECGSCGSGWVQNKGGNVGALKARETGISNDQYSCLSCDDGGHLVYFEEFNLAVYEGLSLETY